MVSKGALGEASLAVGKVVCKEREQKVSAELTPGATSSGSEPDGKQLTNPLATEEIDSFPSSQLGVSLTQSGDNLSLESRLEATAPFSEGAGVVCSMSYRERGQLRLI
jgi:hypothetical protein